MAKTAEQVINNIKSLLDEELSDLVVRRNNGRELIEHELDTGRKKALEEYWNELDEVYKRLLLVHSILANKTKKSNKIDCAVCLGLVTEEEVKELEDAEHALVAG